MFKLMSACVDDLCHAECETLEGLVKMQVVFGTGDDEVLTVSEYLIHYGGYIEHEDV